MRTATVREAQHHLSKLLAEVEKGAEILITRRGKEVGKLVPIKKETRKKVNWKEVMEEMDERLGDLPKFDQNPVLVMREEERF